MPPSKKNIKEKETENKSVKKEVKEVKKEKEVKGKKEVKNKSEQKKWAEVTDDEYHDENDTDENTEEKSEKSISDISEDNNDLDEEILIGTLKAISTNLVKNKSVVDFDYDEINMMDVEELSDYDTNTLLKVLMVRGTKNNNPILWSKTRTLLKLLNFELKPNQPFRNNNNNNNNNRRNFNNNDRRDNRREERRDNRREDNYFHQKKIYENKNGPLVNDKEEENEIVHEKKKTWRGGKK